MVSVQGTNQPANREAIMLSEASRRYALPAALAAVLALSGAAPATAEPRELAVDIAHTAVFWKISHGGFTHVLGQFRKIDLVEITFDPEDVANSKVKASIEAASLDSNHYYRDNFTRSEQFLNAREFKDITFVSTEVEQTGENTGTMTGDLTLRGVTKPVTFDVTYNKTGEHLSGNYLIDGFSAATTIKRSEFGIDAFIPWVGDEVEIMIEIEGHHGQKDG
jgi:polyisoprenoid-binding protein YceI